METPEQITQSVAATAAKLAESVAARSAYDALMADTLRDIRSALGRVEEKTDRVGLRMDALVDTTNHRLDDFREDMNEHRKEVALLLADKVDKTGLLTSVGFRLADIKAVRWSLGALFAAVVGTAVVQHWWGEIIHIFGF